MMERASSGKGAHLPAGDKDKPVVTTKGELSSFLFSASSAASSSPKIRLFCAAAACLDARDGPPGGIPLRKLLQAMYGGNHATVEIFLPLPRVFVMLVREAADQARINEPPEHINSQADRVAEAAANGEPPPVTVAWGSAFEALKACALPKHIESLAVAYVEKIATKLELEGVDDPRALEVDEVLNVIDKAWKKLKKQHSMMLGEKFDEYDEDGDGIVSVSYTHLTLPTKRIV